MDNLLELLAIMALFGVSIALIAIATVKQDHIKIK